ncbi:AMP-binding protein [Streptomyces sp. NPDC048441]|uniref:class I adenylate-forming enzyme family protein n=1 Tax=Streptomyces sp. NPDC048441 TaxID=3365552 RepID=UPI003711354E
MASHRRKPINLGLLFDWHAQNSKQTEFHLDRPFDVAPEKGTVYSGRAISAEVQAISGWLQAAGLRYGDTVAVVKDNHFDMVLLASAAARTGVLPVMISPFVPPAQLRVMLERAAPKVLVTSSDVLARAAKESIEIVPAGVGVVVTGELDTELPQGAVPLADLRGAADPGVRLRPDDEPMIVTHTSGTTGTPKLVVHAAGTSLGRFSFQLESKRIPGITSGRGDVVAGCFSYVHNRLLSWTNGQLSLAPRKTVIMSDPDLDNVAEVLATHRPTSLEALPNMFQRWEELADSRPELFAQVLRYNSTFDAVHRRTIRTFLDVSRARFPIWATGHGQSEIAGISMNVFTRRQARNWQGFRDGSNVGWPPAAPVKVVDPVTGRRKKRGETGLLMVAGKARCLTYMGEPERYLEKVEGKWWNTGDLGRRDRLGRIRTLDREVDLVPGLSSIELESLLLDRLRRAHEVVVLGAQEGPPVPVLSMRDNQITPEEWQRATTGLPELAQPHLVPWEDLPRTATWKVRRHELREMVLGSDRTFGTGRWT